MFSNIFAFYNDFVCLKPWLMAIGLYCTLGVLMYITCV